MQFVLMPRGKLRVRRKTAAWSIAILSSIMLVVTITMFSENRLDDGNVPRLQPMQVPVPQQQQQRELEFAATGTDEFRVNIGLVACGDDSQIEAAYVIKSILLFTRNVDVIDFCVVTCGSDSLSQIFQETLTSPAIRLEYHAYDLQAADIEEYTHRMIERVGYDLLSAGTQHRIFKLLKVFFHEFFPHLKHSKLIILDTDVLAVASLHRLWIEAFGSSDKEKNAHPDIIWRFAWESPQMMNSGVWLFDYKQFMHYFRGTGSDNDKYDTALYDAHLRQAIGKCCHVHGCGELFEVYNKHTGSNSSVRRCGFADQSVMNGMQIWRPWLVGSIRVEWNLVGCFDFFEYAKETEKEVNVLFPGILHFNCYPNTNSEIAFEPWSHHPVVAFVKHYQWKWFNVGPGGNTVKYFKR